MGIFQSRPEEPAEWAGVPSEPWEPGSAAETLPAPVEGPAGLGGARSASVSISLTDVPAENTD